MKYYYLKRHKGVFKYFQNGKTKYGYRFTYYDSSHKRHEKSKRGFNDIINAIKARTNIKSLKDSNSHKNLTVKTWCLHFINMIKPPIRKVTTYISYKTLLTNDVIPTIGNYKLKDISLDTYQNKCLNHLLKKGLSRTTVIEINARVQTIMNYAVKAQYLKLNQLRFANVPNVNVKPKRVIMNEKQLNKFNRNLKTHSLQLQVIYFTLEWTGLRAGELLGLHINDIDTKNRIINIRFTRDEYGVRKPKTPSSIRKIKIPVQLVNLLKQYIVNNKKKFYITNDSLLILGKHGKPLIPKTLSIRLRQLLIECGLKKLVGRFVVHCLRHQFASRMINLHVSPIAVARMLGHSNSAITLKYYAQNFPGEVPDVSKFLNGNN